MKRFVELKREYLRAMRVGWFLALRQLRRSNKGTTILIIAIMVLTFLNLVVVSGILLGIISGSFKEFRESYAGEVIITSPDKRDHIEGSSEFLAFLRSDPRVRAITTRYSIGSQILGTLTDLPGKNERANIIGTRVVGIDPLAEEKVTGFSRFLKYGETLAPGDDGHILIGANLLKQYSSFADANIPGLDLLTGVDVGSRVRVTFNVSRTNSVSKEFIVKGIVKSKVDEISTRMFVVDSEIKRALSVNQTEYQEIAVRTDSVYAPRLVASLKNFAGNKYLARIQTSEEAVPSFLRDVEKTFGILGNALSSIALIVASITIFIVVFINAVTKRKFIGIMKGIGISPTAILFSYILQAFFYGVAGSIIGLFLTFGFLKPYFDAYPIDFPFSNGILVVTAFGAIIRVAILLIVTLVAGYIPAKLIVRKNTLDAILGR